MTRITVPANDVRIGDARIDQAGQFKPVVGIAIGRRVYISTADGAEHAYLPAMRVRIARW